MKKILVIEDDLSIQQVITDVLENEGYNIFTAQNGKLGINLAKEIKPDLIICDVMMPVVNGYEVLSQLLKDKETSLIPFIFLSAKVEKDNIRYGIELGADDYLTKPFKIDELLNAVEIRFKKKELFLEHLKVNNENSTEENLGQDGYLALKQNGQPKIIKVDSITCITAFADYSNVFTSDGSKIVVRRLLKEWEKLLPGNIFLRIHRSTIININAVSKIENWFNNSLSVHLKNIDRRFIISRRQSAKFKNHLHYK
jgi:DNA-binding LytR/AlgR family response regulator